MADPPSEPAVNAIEAVASPAVPTRDVGAAGTVGDEASASANTRPVLVTVAIGTEATLFPEPERMFTVPSPFLAVMMP